MYGDRVQEIRNTSRNAVRDSGEGGSKTLIGSTAEIDAAIRAESASASYKTAKTYAI